jgi:hypothetical protein
MASPLRSFYNAPDAIGGGGTPRQAVGGGAVRLIDILLETDKRIS